MREELIILGHDPGASGAFGEEVRDHYWRRKKDNGRAEAALLCHYYLEHIVKGED